METPEEAGDPDEASGVMKALEAVWNGVILADTKWNPETSCFQLAEDYRHSGRTPEQCARNFVGWQMTKAGGAGFALGLPGFAFMPLTIPADLVSVAYLQLRMVAVIGLLFGWDVRSDQFRTTAYMSLLGSAAGELAREFGIQATTRIATGLIKKHVSGAVLKKINSAVGTRLLTKAGSTGVVNLTKAVPLLGGVVGGSLNIVTTRMIGRTAVEWLKEGPPPEEADGEGATIDGFAEVGAPRESMSSVGAEPVIGKIDERQREA
jgi:uncharacterized protein (DUF697 family)